MECCPRVDGRGLRRSPRAGAKPAKEKVKPYKPRLRGVARENHARSACSMPGGVPAPAPLGTAPHGPRVDDPCARRPGGARPRRVAAGIRLDPGPGVTAPG